MSPAPKRTDRVAALIQEEIAAMLLRGEIHDPRIGMVTLTGVKVSADLRHAIVFFSRMGEPGERTRSEAGLNSASGFIQRELGRRIRMKLLPEIRFVFDNSLEFGQEVEGILRRIHEGENELAEDGRTATGSEPDEDVER